MLVDVRLEELARGRIARVAAADVAVLVGDGVDVGVAFDLGDDAGRADHFRVVVGAVAGVDLEGRVRISLNLERGRAGVGDAAREPVGIGVAGVTEAGDFVAGIGDGGRDRLGVGLHGQRVHVRLRIVDQLGRDLGDADADPVVRADRRREFLPARRRESLRIRDPLRKRVEVGVLEVDGRGEHRPESGPLAGFVDAEWHTTMCGRASK